MDRTRAIWRYLKFLFSTKPYAGDPEKAKEVWSPEPKEGRDPKMTWWFGIRR